MNQLIYWIIALPLLAAIMIGGYWSYIFLYKRSAYIWLLPYLKFRYSQSQIRNDSKQPKHILFMFVDHFEPFNGKVTRVQARERVQYWQNEYPRLVASHHDADGKPPQHTWFYPAEQDLSFLAELAKLAFRGLGEIEVHLHHSNDTSEQLNQKLELAKQEFSKRGANVTAEQSPKNVFGFIHGNWALANSHPRGLWCGVNDEISILQKSGCYGDFTLPSAPSPTQTKKINSIYYAKEIPNQPKSHNDGIDAKVGFRNREDFLLVQGPLTIYRNSHHRFLPSIENGEICDTNYPNPRRVDEWIGANIHVKDRPEWIFVKIHTHGATQQNWPAIFGKSMHEMFSYLESRYNDGVQYKLHYITTREAYNIIKAAEDGKTGDPGIYRDYIIPPYANTRIKSNVLFELISYSKTRLEIKNLQPHFKSVFFIKKGQLEKIEGMMSHFKVTRDLEHRKLNVAISGEKQISMMVRTSLNIKGVTNGQVNQVRKLKGFYLSQIRAFFPNRGDYEIVINW
ncbi:hypothetical protein L0128_15010 [candidate division KSB1 bacterium]|nr:hypothetical protein [candidate division KSB1 bacterium]